MNENLTNIIRKIRELLGTRRRLDELSRRLEQNTNAIRAADESNQQEHKIQNERLDNILAEYKQSEGNKTTNDERHYRVQNSIRWATWCAFIAAGIYAGLTYRMLCAVQEQTRIQREAAINTERAWVGLDVPITLDAVDIAPEASKIDGHYTIKNFGQGPALKVVQVGDFVDLDMAMDVQKREADFYCNSAVNFTNGTVPVGGEMKQPPPFGYTLFPGQQHTELIQFGGKIPEKTATFLRFIGCVAYIDQFKTTHWTRFCMEHKPGSPPTPVGSIPKLDFCAMYNDTDEPKQN